jgi:hypothetical protein
LESALNAPKDKNAGWKNEVRVQQGLKPLESAELPKIKIEPYTDLIWAWNGFWRLSNVRPVGFNGVMRIPMVEVEAYCRLHGYEYARRTELLFYIERLDSAFMEHVEKKREEQERAERNKSNEIGGNRRGKRPARR